MLESVDANLEFFEIGGLNHLGWLTLGCRILQFYVAQEKPISNLNTLAEFLIKVYFHGWFRIKFNNKNTDGPKNYYNILTQVMEFSNKIIQDIVVAVLQRNAYFADHENILLAMLADNDGVVVRASASQSVDLGFISLVESYQKTLKNGIRSFRAWRSEFRKGCREQAGKFACCVLGQGT